jgi:CheY-like chemotaxis protein
MKPTITMIALASAALAALTVPPARACGEGQFNMGQGLGYQAYLAPIPAAVLVLAPDADQVARRQLYQGLERAGHRVTLVGDEAALRQALAGGHYDVVIAGFDRVEALDGQASALHPSGLIPVVSRAARRDPRLRADFAAFLLENASLGQYLRAINTQMHVAAR